METVQKRIRPLQARDFSGQNEAKGALAQELKKTEIIAGWESRSEPHQTVCQQGKAGSEGTCQTGGLEVQNGNRD